MTFSIPCKRELLCLAASLNTLSRYSNNPWQREQSLPTMWRTVVWPCLWPNIRRQSQQSIVCCLSWWTIVMMKMTPVVPVQPFFLLKSQQHSKPYTVNHLSHCSKVRLRLDMGNVSKQRSINHLCGIDNRITTNSSVCKISSCNTNSNSLPPPQCLIH